ncbi:TonB-dependent receptor [Niabella insulamsoli]|uniref:TonB-dependent receptor n=1 Tax=Niabella insulamsoli TaxID=3144874 RepID=UPI0031FBC608
MKMLMILLTVACLQVSASGFSQETVSLNLREANIKEVLAAVQQQTDYRFIYHDKGRLDKEFVTIHVKNASVRQILDAILVNTNYSYSLLNNRLVAITETGPKIRPITGKVTDAKGDPIAGVSVQVKNSQTGTITDANGQFSLDIPSGTVLVISAVGYVTKEIALDNENSVNVMLEAMETKMDEVVVVAYGSESRQTQTSAVSSIKASDIVNIPSAQLSTSLAGRLPGAQIVQNSGFVGSNASISIRGAGQAPLYVIDNVVSDKAQFDVLDPNEVESVSILKDAAAAAIYGARAAGGVVVVQTRSGKKGKVKVNYRGIVSTSRTVDPLQDWTPEQELIYRNSVAKHNNRASANPDPNFQVPFNEEALAYARTIQPQSVNDILWRNPFAQQHSLDVSGGSDNVRYFFSGNYSNNKGSYDHTSFDKYTLRAKVDADVSKNLKVGTNISFNRRNTNRFFWPYDNDGGEGFTVADFYRPTFNLSRLYPFYAKADGTPTTADDPEGYPTIQPGWGFNPAQIVNSVNYRDILYNTFNAVVNAELQIPQVKGLSLRVLGNYRQDNLFQKDFIGEHNISYRVQTVGSSGIDLLKLAPLKFDANNRVVNNYGKSFTSIDEETYLDERYQTNMFIDYTRSFGQHRLTSFVGVEQYQFSRKYMNGTAEDLLTPNIDQILAANPARERRNFNGSELNQARLSYFGRAKYDYASKYIAEFSFRQDGSYIFPEGKQFGFFPSVAAGWVVSKEQFFNVDPISTLKVRASYGTTGYDGIDGLSTNIAPFQFQNNYNVVNSFTGTGNGGYVFANSSLTGLAPQNVVPNPDITWAINKTINGGIDMGFFNDALTFSFDYFTTKRSRILVSRSETIPGTFGTSLPQVNIGEQKVRGWEATINYAQSRGDFYYSVGLNAGYAIDEYVSWPQSANLPAYRNLIGQPTSGLVYGYVSKGLVKDQAVIDALPAGFTQFGRDVQLGYVLLEDINGDGFAPGADGKVDVNDQTVISTNAVPRLNFGAPIDLRWRNFSLNIFLQGVGSYDKFVKTLNTDASGGVFQLADRPYFELWTEAYEPDLNPGGKYPTPSNSWTDPDRSGSSSTFWIRNGAYVRLKNLNIAYAVPKSIISRVGLQGVQLNLNATNLLTLSSFKEHDPEQRSLDSYPIFKTYSFGLNISL